METLEISVFPEIKLKSCKRNVLKEVHLTNYQPCTNIVFENLNIFKLNVHDIELPWWINISLQCGGEGLISFIKT